MKVQEPGRMAYREAWALQEKLHEEVLAKGEESLLVVEHPPVITYGRRPGVKEHLLASEEMLDKLGVECVESDRGGDITYHGPGQVVAYPIIRLVDHRMSVSGYVHALEKAVARTLLTFGIQTSTDPCAIGVWVGTDKIAAIGVRIRRGVTLHGLALNVTTDLSYFDLILPCGLVGKGVTSLQYLLKTSCPSQQQVQKVLIEKLQETFS